MKGNERLSKLVGYLHSRDYKFSGSFKSPIGARRVIDLRKRIKSEKGSEYPETIARYQEAFSDPRIQEAFQLGGGGVVDLSLDLRLQNGKVYALCLNEVGPTYSLKDPVIAGLFLMNLMTPGIPIEDMDTLADCGIFNSANATRHYARHFGLRGEYWMPTNMEHLAKRLRTDDFLIHHENERFASEENEAKNACYRTLFERLHKDKDFSGRAFYLGHSELGWAAMYPVAQRNADLLESKGITPTVLFSCIGAGTFFVPHAEVFHQRFGTKPVLGEYEEFHPMTDGHDLKIQVVGGMPEYIPEHIAQMAREKINSGREVISRKFSENPFIPQTFWDLVGESYLMGGDPADLATVLHFRDKGRNIGITTGGVLSVASEIANKGETVVVPIYEGFRDYAVQNQDIESRVISFSSWFNETKMRERMTWGAAAATYMISAGYCWYDMLANNTPFFNGFTLVK
jgi:hypothetical protein